MRQNAAESIQYIEDNEWIMGIIGEVCGDKYLPPAAKVYLINRMISTNSLSKSNPKLIKGSKLGYSYSQSSQYNRMLFKYIVNRDYLKTS